MILILNDRRIIQYITLLVFIVAAFLSQGYHHFDEHFQILEFANYKLGFLSKSDLPWEYTYKIRSTLQPTIVIVLYKFLELFGTVDPFFLATTLRLVSALFSFLIIKHFFQLFVDEFEDEFTSRWYLLFSFLLWFQFYVGVRFSSETWSANFFLLAFILYFRKNLNKNLVVYYVVGITLGIAFLFRFQSALMTFGFLVWLLLVQKEKFLNLLLIVLGGLLVVGFGVVIDSWFYGETSIAFWNYFQQCTVENKVVDFETQPWWYYFWKFFIKAIPPLSLLIMGGLLYFLFKKRLHPVSWIVLPFLITHLLIGHKEIRFLYPIIGFLPFIFVSSLKILNKKYKIESIKLVKKIFQLSWIVNVVFVAVVAFRPADSHIPLYNTIYRKYDCAATIYHLGKNPYHRVLGINFYKRQNLTIRKISSLSELNLDVNEKTLLVVDQKRNLSEDFLSKANVVYNTFPDWMLNLNFNNWQQRTKGWKVYEIR